MLGQCGRRELFRDDQARAHRDATVADASRASARGLQLHRRLVQHEAHRHSSLGYKSPAVFEAINNNVDRQAA
jgi:hypothetical protein